MENNNNKIPLRDTGIFIGWDPNSGEPCPSWGTISFGEEPSENTICLGDVIMTFAEAMKEITWALDVLNEKIPCPECEGYGTTPPIGDGYDYPESWCKNCNGTGIKLPESEA